MENERLLLVKDAEKERRFKVGDRVLCFDGDNIISLKHHGRIGTIIRENSNQFESSFVYEVDFGSDKYAYHVYWLHKTISQEIIDDQLQGRDIGG